MFHRPARTAVSVIGIAVGVLLIVFTIGLANGTMREQGRREANVGAEIMFRASGTRGLSGSESFRILESDGERILETPGVAAIAPIGQNTVAADETNTGNRLIDGIDFPSYAKIVGITIIEGRKLSTDGDEAIIDTGFQRQQGYRVGQKLKLYDRDFTIVGTYEPAAGARVKIPLSTMQDQLGSNGKISAFLVKINQGEDVREIAERLQTHFPNSQILLTSELEELYMKGFPALNVFLNVFIGVAAVISALVILLTMYTTVIERTRQIGIMKSLGMSNIRIAATIAQEAMLISLLGVVLGIALAFVLRFIITRFTALEVEMSPAVLFITLIVGLIGGVIGSLYPAIRSARLDAVDALAYD